MTHLPTWKSVRVAIAVVGVGALVGCNGGSDDDDDGGAINTPAPTSPAPPTATVPPTAMATATVTPTPGLDIAVCDPGAGPFSATITHPFSPLPVGTRWVLEGEEEDDGELLAIRVEITALDETAVVAGVTTRIVEEREWEDDELVEVSRNFFAMNPAGDLCYFGEDVDDYEDGEIVGHEGAWRAGEDGNLPGILLPATPQVGQIFQQEAAPGIAEDTAEILALGETVTVDLGTFSDTLRLEERNPLDGDSGEKVYGRDVGLLIDEELERIVDDEV